MILSAVHRKLQTCELWPAAVSTGHRLLLAALGRNWVSSTFVVFFFLSPFFFFNTPSLVCTRTHFFFLFKGPFWSTSSRWKQRDPEMNSTVTRENDLEKKKSCSVQSCSKVLRETLESTVFFKGANILITYIYIYVSVYRCRYIDTVYTRVYTHFQRISFHLFFSFSFIIVAHSSVYSSSTRPYDYNWNTTLITTAPVVLGRAGKKKNLCVYINLQCFLFFGGVQMMFVT